MTREEWMKLYDDLQAVAEDKKDILELDTETRGRARLLNLLRRDRNGNTVLTKFGKDVVG